MELIFYIHYNPQKHGLIDDFKNWTWSSYQALVSGGKTKLMRKEVIELFGNKNAFEEFHLGKVNERKISNFIGEV